jgi:hypothetical protein
MRFSGSLTVEPGTAMGVRNEPVSGQSSYTYWGLDLRENSSVVSHGMPNRPNIIADTQTVQEQDEYACSSLIVPDFQGSSADAAPSMDFRFNRLYAPAGGFAVWGGDWEFVYYGHSLASYDSLVNWTMRDSEVHGGRISLGLPNSSMDWTQYYGSGVVDWENNLFENVNINLNPATWWYNGVVNFDEAFTARNNLFKGANWMALEPVPASAGDWTFTDNLFDGIDFQTDPAAPLDFDFNGYYPLPASQTLYNTLAYELSLTAGDTTALFSSTNDLGGLHEVLMDYSLPYVSGAFGNYYLSTVTPLWQAGSRTAGDAGLSQYTTVISQAKDSASQPVTIGLHYVAATNSLPLDTDGDGVPDYVEVEHGTDPNNAMTDGVTPDAYNTAFDDVDLSGVGLTGAAKRLLCMNPLSMDNPLNLAAIPQQSTLSGIVQIPLNIGTNVDTNASILFDINGLVGNTTVIQSNGNWFAQWDTTAVPNGTYQVQLEYPFDDDISAFGVTSFINVQNDVCFPNNLSICGSALFAVPQTVNTNGTFTMDVYDDQTNLVTSVSGSVDANGDCNDPNTSQPGITVSLQDTNGVDLPSSYFTIVVTTWPAVVSNQGAVHANGLGGGGHGRRRFGHEGAWNGVRGWVMAYMPIFGTEQSVSSSKLNELMGTAAAAVLNNPGYGTEGILNGEYTTADGYASAMTLSASRDWGTLASLLHDTSSRNFYYFGHAGKALLGSKKNSNYFDGNNLEQILRNSANPLTTNSLWQHPYRFVFLDGCQTAAGTLSALFGIPNMVVTNEVWAAAGLAPRSFLGWQSYTGTSFKSNGKPIYDNTRLRYMENFWNNWSGNQRLQDAIHAASADDDSNNQRFCQFDNIITLYGSPTLPFYQ